MRVKTVAWLAVATIFSVSLTAWSLIRYKEITSGPEPAVLSPEVDISAEVDIAGPAAPVDAWRFRAPGTLAMDG